MPRTSIAIVFAGSGGSGAMSAGAVLLRAAAHAGYYGLMTQLFGAQVRGGESAALVQVSTQPIDSQPDRYDLFVALDWEKVEQFAAEIPLDEASVIIADPAAGAVPPGIAKSKGRVVALTMGDRNATKLERGLLGRRVNMFAAGLVGALIGLNEANLQAAAEAVFSDKGADVIGANAKGTAAGIAAAASLTLNVRLDAPTAAARWLISGNQAIAFGALRGGVRFVGCYPITPATDLVEWLAPHLIKLGGRLVLGEDELASINLALGASYGGTPAMTVTAGPGFSLMVESLGLAVAAESPLVLVDVMRAGPSTGIASKTEQSDINLALYGAHGDAPRVVMAPVSVADCITTAEYAVYVAESLQTPVIVLSDQALGQATTVIDPSDKRPAPLKRRLNGAAASKPFKRYAIGGDPVTPMPLPGTPQHEWVAEGLSHNEAGLPASGAGPHVAQINKRAKKIARFDPGAYWGETWGTGDTVVLAIGSTIGAAREAARRLSAAGHQMRVVALRVIAPLPTEALSRALAGARRIIVIEQNHSGQLYHYLVGQKAIPPNAESVARPGPLPFRPSEIASYVV
ncbi:2-oxoacid:acceptor oxidoreductase subunit alpha [Pseudolabrys taiwanensis]|nr:2-oxoacid:acceptor oxidoreductase subunit alpha [Pseudolabrys taiwanensis]